MPLGSRFAPLHGRSSTPKPSPPSWEKAQPVAFSSYDFKRTKKRGISQVCVAKLPSRLPLQILERKPSQPQLSRGITFLDLGRSGRASSPFCVVFHEECTKKVVLEIWALFGPPSATCSYAPWIRFCPTSWLVLHPKTWSAFLGEGTTSGLLLL